MQWVKPMTITYAMFTRLGDKAVESPSSLEKLEKDVVRHIRTDCPGVKWVHNYALLGPWDYLDIFEAPDHESALKVATLVRIYGHAQTEILGATEWRRYKELMHQLQPDIVSATHL